MNRQVHQLRNKLKNHEKAHSELQTENESLKAQLSLVKESFAPEDLGIQLINTNEILKETQDQLKKLEEHNLLIQNKLTAKPPPKGKLQNEIIRLKGVIQNKNKLLQGVSNIPKVIVHIDGTEDKIELKNINIRKRVVDLLEAANKRKESKIHVHINDDRIVDISDENIKMQLKSLIKESKKNINQKTVLNEIKALLNEVKINNKGVHVHLDDETAVEFIDDEIKNRLLDLMANAESVVDETNNLSLLENNPGNITYGANVIGDDYEDDDDDEEGDEDQDEEGDEEDDEEGDEEDDEEGDDYEDDDEEN